MWWLLGEDVESHIRRGDGLLKKICRRTDLNIIVH